MKIKRVRVIKSKKIYWYSNKIGEEFYVEDCFREHAFLPKWKSYRVIPFGTHKGGSPERRYLYVDDVEVLEELDGKVIEITTILLSGKDLA